MGHEIGKNAEEYDHTIKYLQTQSVFIQAGKIAADVEVERLCN